MIKDKIAFVILNYNTYDMTLKLVNNIERIIPDRADVEIIVVDNKSTNESATVLDNASKKRGRYYFIANDKNAGYAAGNNIGIKYAINNGAEYIIVTNNDIEIESYDTIKKMVGLMRVNKQIGAISPQIVSKDGKKDPPLYVSKPTFWDMTFGIILSHKKRFQFNENKNCKIYAPRGSFMLLRALMMQQIDYLDEGTFLYYEEPILAERLNTINAECWFCGDAKVIHNHGKTITTSIKKKQTCKILCESFDYYLKKYRKFGLFKRKSCVSFRWMSYMLRR